MWAEALPHLQSAESYPLTVTDVRAPVPGFRSEIQDYKGRGGLGMGIFLDRVPTQTLESAVKVNK